MKYFVVRNSLDNYSIWPEGKRIPKGWKKIITGTMYDCLDFLEKDLMKEREEVSINDAAK